MSGIRNAAVVVLGDIGRSPRMQNHALEILNNTDYNVYFVGYHENRSHDSIENNDRITIVPVSTWWLKPLQKLPKIFYYFYAIVRLIIQTL